MVVVVDTNILIQCIINIKGKTALLITENSFDINFVVPEFVIFETKGKESKIYSSSTLRRGLFGDNLKILLGHVVIIKDDEITKCF